MRINQVPVKKIPSLSVNSINLSVFSNTQLSISSSSSSSASSVRSLSRKSYSRKSTSQENDSQPAIDLSQVLHDLSLSEISENEDDGENASSGESDQPRDLPQMQEIPIASSSSAPSTSSSSAQPPRPKAYARKSTAKPPQNFVSKYRTKPTVPRRNGKSMDNYKSLLDESIPKIRPVKKYKRRPGVLALKEIRHFQQTTHLLIPKIPFQRLVKEIVQGLNEQMRMRKEAVEALQVASEDFLTQRFEDSNLMTLNCNRVTVFPRDMQLVKRVHGHGL